MMVNGKLWYRDKGDLKICLRGNRSMLIFLIKAKKKNPKLEYDGLIDQYYKKIHCTPKTYLGADKKNE